MGVDEDDRHIGSLEPKHILVGRRQRHDEEAICPLAQREGQEVLVPLLDRLDVVDDEVKLAVGKGGVDATEPLSGLRSGQELDDDRDRLGLAKAEPTGGQARSEVELLGHLDDPSFGAFVDERAAIQGS